MAVVIAFRLAIALGTSRVGVVALRWVAAGGATTAGAYERGLVSWWDRLHDSSEDPAVLTAEMGGEGAEASWIVTDFTGTFELRKLQWRLSRAPAGGTVEDQDTMTFHFIKATGGTPGAYVDGTDLPAVETALTNYWAAIKGQFPAFVHNDQYRWYKDGPAFYVLNDAGTAYVPIGGNAAIRVTEVDVAGAGGAGLPVAPPQTAMTITERTSSRLHWGRYYLPAPTSDMIDTAGRIDNTLRAAHLASAVTFYNACRTAHMVPVVWSIQKPERPRKPSGTLPAYDAQAFEVLELQMDNLFDVIRSRRYSMATAKTRTVLT